MPPKRQTDTGMIGRVNGARTFNWRRGCTASERATRAQGYKSDANPEQLREANRHNASPALSLLSPLRGVQ